MSADSPLHVLLLAGTGEAAALDRALAGRTGFRVTASLAGVTRRPTGFNATLRSGGFGGAPGFAAFLRAQQVDVVVNATHPFAARISRTVREVTRELALPAIRLLRPAWQPPAGAQWLAATDLPRAAHLLPPHATGFLALGQRHLAAFRDHPARLVVRSLEPPQPDLLPRAQWITGPPGSSVAGERELFARAGITHLVARNSGGAAGWAKVAAAAGAGLPTIMIARPAQDDGPVLATVTDVLGWLETVGQARGR